MRKVALAAGIVALIVSFGNSATLIDSLAQAVCASADLILPEGQVSPSPSGDPLIPAYCISASPAMPTRVSGANDWVDDFGVVGIARLNDGDMGYRVFDRLAGVAETGHLVVGDHWIDDNKVQFGGGAMLRPNRSFVFEKGKLVVEGDISAGKSVYRGDQWAEFVVSTSPEIDTNPPDAAEQAYAYGRFKGFPTFGCRFQATAENTCVAFTGSTLSFPPTQDKAPCYSLSPDRLWELSFFQHCGDYFGGTHFGGFSDPGRSVWRVCSATDDYDPCLDRFRIELTATSLVIYVNGILYFEDAGWDTEHQLPAGLLTGPVYVYFADWGTIAPHPVYRFHWERLAVNPHDASGNFLPPSASPTFKGGSPTSTPTPQSTATPTPRATATGTVTTAPTPTPGWTPTATPSATPTTTLTPTPTPTSASDQFGQPMFLTFNDLTNPNRVLNGQYPSGIIDWGTDAWWLSGPYGLFTTQSLSFNGSGPTSASFTFSGTHTVVQLDAYNGGTSWSNVSVACVGQPTVQATLAPYQLKTIPVGWTAPCRTVTISSSNGWDTNFDNLKIK